MENSLIGIGPTAWNSRQVIRNRPSICEQRSGFCNPSVDAGFQGKI